MDNNWAEFLALPHRKKSLLNSFWLKPKFSIRSSKIQVSEDTSYNVAAPVLPSKFYLSSFLECFSLWWDSGDFWEVSWRSNFTALSSLLKLLAGYIYPQQETVVASGFLGGVDSWGCTHLFSLVCFSDMVWTLNPLWSLGGPVHLWSGQENDFHSFLFHGCPLGKQA